MKLPRVFMYVADKSKVEIIEEHRNPDNPYFDYKYRLGMVLEKLVCKHSAFTCHNFDYTKPNGMIKRQMIRCVVAKNRTQAIRWIKREWHRKHAHRRAKR